MKYEMDQVSIRMVKEPPLISEKPIVSPESAVDILADFLSDFDRELIALVNLRTDGKPINMNIMSMGTLNYTVSVPREALKASILSNANSIIIFHNHPSGHLKPSKQDIEMTDQMIRAYELLGISVMDHIIVAPDKSFYSMRMNDVFRTPAIEYGSQLKDLSFGSLRRPENHESR